MPLTTVGMVWGQSLIPNKLLDDEPTQLSINSIGDIGPCKCVYFSQARNQNHSS